MIKPWYQSITIWVNAIIILSAVLAALAAPDVVEHLPAWVGVSLPPVLAILNIILRALTGQPVSTYGAQRANK